MRRTARTRFVPLLVVLCAALLPLNAGGQSVVHARAGIRPSIESADSAPGRRGPSLAAATLASAVVPGAGQAMLRSGRAFIYAGVETLGWIRYSRQQGDGNRFRARYRELSRVVARAAFNPAGPDGDWYYYERLAKSAAGGGYDRGPGGDLEPEPDPET